MGGFGGLGMLSVRMLPMGGARIVVLLRRCKKGSWSTGYGALWWAGARLVAEIVSGRGTGKNMRGGRYWGVIGGGA